MRIGIIGSGNVGGTLGTGFARAGHEVVFGFRDPASPGAASLLGRAPGTRAATVAEAAASSTVLVLATPYEAAEAALAPAGDLSGKILLDATNPIAPGLAGVSSPAGSSGAEEIAKLARGARVVKIFNTVGFEVMANPTFLAGARPATMLYAGDDTSAKEVAHGLAAGLGFDPVDLGPLAAARLLEPFALVWIRLALLCGHGRETAFVYLHR